MNMYYLEGFLPLASGYILSIYYLYACLLSWIFSHSWGSGAMASNLDFQRWQFLPFPLMRSLVLYMWGTRHKHHSVQPDTTYRTAGEEGAGTQRNPEARQLAAGWGLFGVLYSPTFQAAWQALGKCSRTNPTKMHKVKRSSEKLTPAFQPWGGLACFPRQGGAPCRKEFSSKS